MTKIASESWIYLSLSSYEGFGVGVIEAMAHGCVAISSENPGSKEIINSFHDGIIATDNLIFDWIYRVIQNDNMRQQLSGNALISSEKYQPQRVAAAFEKIYETII